MPFKFNRGYGGLITRAKSRCPVVRAEGGGPLLQDVLLSRPSVCRCTPATRKTEAGQLLLQPGGRGGGFRRLSSVQLWTCLTFIEYLLTLSVSVTPASRLEANGIEAGIEKRFTK